MSTPASDGSGPPLSTGTLCYLFGDRVAKPAGRFGGTVVPHAGVKVSQADLAALVLAVSFWGLREQGVLRLTLTVRRRFGFVVRRRIELVATPEVTERSGYDDLILGQVAQGRTSVYAVVRGWFRRDVNDPEGTVLAVAEREMVTHGLAREVDAERGAVGGFLLGRTRVEPDLDRIEQLWRTFEQTLAGWQRFQRDEPELAALLVKRCHQGIVSRRESSTS